MTIPFMDLKKGYVELKERLDLAYRRVMESGSYILGQETAGFEDKFALYCGTSHCVGVGNGFDALFLILRGYGIGPGDEVIVPSNTYIATWLAVSQAGAIPVPVEPDPVTRNIDPRRIEAAITGKTKAIIPVHLYGLPADMAPVMELAQRHGLKVIEDNSQAHGALYRGGRTGGRGHAAASSFYPTKNLGCFGDGGAVTTNDPLLAERVRVLRNYGSKVRYQNEALGYNSRLDELQAAFLSEKLPLLDEWNQRRSKIAGIYLRELAKAPSLTLPAVPEGSEPVWHLFVIECASRDGLHESLRAKGIETLIHYPVPPHLSGAYAGMDFRTNSFPLAEKLAGTVLSLPIGPHMTEGAALEVAEGVLAAVKSNLTARRGS
jgi:dTDP-4-amino-4,6-dideoxygalactose transaminase